MLTKLTPGLLPGIRGLGLGLGRAGVWSARHGLRRLRRGELPRAHVPGLGRERPRFGASGPRLHGRLGSSSRVLVIAGAGALSLLQTLHGFLLGLVRVEPGCPVIEARLALLATLRLLLLVQVQVDPEDQPRQPQQGED